MAKHRATTAVIKGSGLSSRTGGFTRLLINGKSYHANDVASAVESQDDMLAALKIALRDIANRAAVDLDDTPPWFAVAYASIFNAIAKAEGRADD